MRKSIFLSLLCLIAIVAVACGSGNNSTNPGNGGETGGETGGENGGGAELSAQEQWDNLYKEGANWTHKGAAGLTKTEVVSVADGVAKIKTSMKMGDADWMDPTDGEVKRPEETTTTADPDPKWKETGSGTETVKVGDADIDVKWVEGEYDGTKMKNVTSTKYGVVVKSEYDGAVTQELTEFNPK